MLKRLALALCFLFTLAPAFAAAPPAVPGLPDTERRTSYSISGSTCACSVGFALYGDSTDVDEWVQVWVGGVRYLSTDPNFGWAITSPTGPLATIPRPITDAVLTFNASQTGTVQIVGARRPRRTTQFTENRGIAARDMNQALTDVIATQREQWDKMNDATGRGLFTQPGNTMAPLPSPTSCINEWLNFGSNGLTPTCMPGGPGSGNVVGPVTSSQFDVAQYNSSTGNGISDGGYVALNGGLSPLSYGAKGDCSTDDSTALSNASSAAVSAGTFVSISRCYAIGSNLALAANLRFDAAGEFTVSSGKTATLSGTIVASDTQQLFAGSGTTVVSMAPRVSVAWWGALTASDPAAAFRAASGSNRTYYIPPISYTFKSTVSVPVTAFDPTAVLFTGTGVANFGTLTGGSSYTNGTYYNVPLTGGAGSGALADVVVSGNSVNQVTLRYPGTSYTTSDNLSATAASIGGTGSGFSIAVNRVGLTNLLIDARGATFAAPSPSKGNPVAIFTFNQCTNCRIDGGTFAGAASALSGSDESGGIGLANTVDFIADGQTFNGNWGGAGTAYYGDYNVRTRIVRQSMTNVSQCFDFAFFLDLTIEHVTAVGAGASGAGVGQKCYSNIYDVPLVGNNTTGFTINDTDRVSINDLNASNFATGVNLWSGQHFAITNSHLHDNPGISPSTEGIGVFIFYSIGVNTSSVGHPVNGVSLQGNIISTNGATVAGVGLDVDASNVSNSDVISNVTAVSNIFDNNSSFGVSQNGTAISNFVISPSNTFSGASQTTNVATGVNYTGQAVVSTSGNTSLTTVTPAQITSISLAPGVWQVSGMGLFNGGATTTVGFLELSISTTSASISAAIGQTANLSGANATLFNFVNPTLTIAPVTFTLTSTTTVYCNAEASFGTSTASVFCNLKAVRVQ